MGFCLFNNIAVAVRHALAVAGVERVMILDWDVHHGNGTNDIFHATDQVLFVSIHRVAAVSRDRPCGGRGLRSGDGLHSQPPGRTVV